MKVTLNGGLKSQQNEPLRIPGKAKRPETIAWHKVRDLENRIDKMVPIQGRLNKTYSEGDNVAFDQARAEHVKLLYRAWSALSDLVELENKSKGGSRSCLHPTPEQWEKAFDKARAIFKEHDQE